MNISRLTIAIQMDENTILTNADIHINDIDMNGVMSMEDRFEISNMTERYRGATIRLIIDDFQIGYNTIGHFE